MSKYPTPFKRSAIQAFLDRGYGFRHVAAQFDIDPTLLRRWVSAYQMHGEASFEKPGRRYSCEFKQSVLHRKWRDQLSFRATAALFNLGNSTQVRRWEEEYYSERLRAPMPPAEMLITAMPKPTHASAKNPTKAVEELTHAELIKRFRELEAENAYLKKLEELDAEKARLKQARKKPS